MKTDCRTPLVALILATLALSTSLPLHGQTPPPAKAAAKKPIAQAIVGTWAIDAPKMLAAMKSKAEKDSGAKIDEAAAAMMSKMVEEMAKGLALEFTVDGKARAHQARKTEDASYKILKAEEASGEFTMEVTPPDEDADSAVGKIEGNTMSLNMKNGQMELHLKRLSKEQAATRLAELQKGKDKDKE